MHKVDCDGHCLLDTDPSQGPSQVSVSTTGKCTQKSAQCVPSEKPGRCFQQIRRGDGSSNAHVRVCAHTQTEEKGTAGSQKGDPQPSVYGEDLRYVWGPHHPHALQSGG